ncbi:MAG: serine/threonine protein kinase, partial [Anaerolineae bacterium]|nr:serine/threonine protein kinase [Anaerolineae bacterium]
MTLPEGSFLEGRYRLDKLLSQGGMGTIYKAFDTKLQVAVAIKENFLQTPQAIEQFEQEALILARLQHSNLPRVSDHFTFDHRQYLVMDFIEGRDLWDLVENNDGPLDEKITLGYILQVCDAVSYLHRQDPQIIHRDIKPQNIKITPDGRAVLVDFGIAKVITADGRTHTGAQAATPGFSPPEQYGGTGTTPQSDIYGLGATLYAVLTGEYPPDSISLLSSAEVFRPPRAVNRALSRQVSEAIEYAMQLRQQDRPASVVDWMQDLKAILAGDIVSTRRPKEDTAQLTSQTRMTEPVPAVLPQTAPIERRRPVWWWLVLGGLAIVMASGITAFIVGQGRGDEASDTEALLVALVASATAQAQAGAIDNTGPDLAATLAALAPTATTQTQLQIEMTRPTETPTATATSTSTATPLPPTPTPTMTAIYPTWTPSRSTPTVVLPTATPKSQRIAFVSNRTGN